MERLVLKLKIRVEVSRSWASHCGGGPDSNQQNPLGSKHCLRQHDGQWRCLPPPADESPGCPRNSVQSYNNCAQSICVVSKKCEFKKLFCCSISTSECLVPKFAGITAVFLGEQSHEQCDIMFVVGSSILLWLTIDRQFGDSAIYAIILILGNIDANP